MSFNFVYSILASPFQNKRELGENTCSLPFVNNPYLTTISHQGLLSLNDHFTRMTTLSILMLFVFQSDTVSIKTHFSHSCSNFLMTWTTYHTKALLLWFMLVIFLYSTLKWWCNAHHCSLSYRLITIVIMTIIITVPMMMKMMVLIILIWSHKKCLQLSVSVRVCQIVPSIHFLVV